MHSTRMTLVGAEVGVAVGAEGGILERLTAARCQGGGKIESKLALQSHHVLQVTTVPLVARAEVPRYAW